MQGALFPEREAHTWWNFEMGLKGNERLLKMKGPAYRVTVDPFSWRNPVTFWQYLPVLPGWQSGQILGIPVSGGATNR